MSPTVAGGKLSAHCLVTPEGTVLRCVDDDRVAYHAGLSRFNGIEQLNGVFLGAEVLLPGTWEYGAFRKAMRDGVPKFADPQYPAVAELIAGWMHRYDIPRGMVTGHETVAGDDVRGPGKGKLDPGRGFDHLRFWGLVHGHLAALRATPQAATG